MTSSTPSGRGQTSSFFGTSHQGLSFTELPSLSLHPVFSVKSNKNFAEMSLHVAEMLEKDAIEPVLDGSPGFYSSMFLVPKRTGGFRPIINLKNLSVVKEKFKMETQRAIRKALHQGEWVTSIDLKDAYFHVPVKSAARKYLRFFHDSQTYQFKALPFGLTSAPQEFFIDSPSTFICIWTIGCFEQSHTNSASLIPSRLSTSLFVWDSSSTNRSRSWFRLRSSPF